MLKHLSYAILRMFGWRINIGIEEVPKAIICVAPHTSNWDFIICELAYTAVGRKSGFLMKQAWFFFPLGLLFKAIGGIPVPKISSGGELVDYIVSLYKKSDKLTLAITPEGTRSLVNRWRTGVVRIAYNAEIPIYLAYVDYKYKTIGIDKAFNASGNIDADMREIKEYYKNFNARYPQKFTTEDE